ncbi:MAG TPA: TonB-dependent receptor [Bacteroidia bacterium]|nr:TonB-dependent receptor [Bacteroidia bacterium]
MRNNHYFLLAFFSIVNYIAVNAQSQGTLKGMVTDGVTKEAVIGAVIYNVSDKTNGVVTDISGNYQLPLKPGTDTVICTIISMQPDTFIVNLDPSASVVHNFVMKSGSQQMETYVVSVGKYERKLEDITVSMEVLKPSLIENKNSSNITDALEQVPGLNVLDGEPQIRGGSGFDFGVGSRVAVLVDGLPAMPGDGSALPWEFIPVENVEQVEVIKGASSVAYGSSALSGSINVRTAYAKDNPVTMVSFSTGFYDKPSVPVPSWLSGPANFSDVSFLHSEKFGQLDLVFGGMLKYDQGYIGPSLYTKTSISSFVDTSVKSNQVGEKTGRFNFNLRYRPKNAPKINYGINGNFMESDNNTTLTWQNDSTGLYRAFPHTLVLKEQDILYVTPFINYLSSDGWSHSFRTRWSYTNNKQTNENYASDTATPNVTTITNTIYGEYQVTKQVNDDLNFTGGLFMNQTYSYNELPFPGVLQTNHLQNYAGFLQIDKKLWKRLNLSVGYREESFRMNSEKNTAIPILRAGANLRIGKETYLRASWGQGYRFPSITEKYIFSNVGPMSIYPNPNLLPETSTNAEIGIKQEFKINNFIGALDFAAFQQEYQNTIEITYGFWAKTFVPPGATPTGFKYLNTGNTQIRGLEVSLPGEGKIAKDLKIDVLADYTYIIPIALQPTLAYATDSLNRPLSYAVHTSTDTKNNILKYRMQTIAKVDVQLTYKKYFIGGDWRYYSFMQNIDTVFYLFDLQAGYGVQQYRDKHDNGINVFDARIGMDATKRWKFAFVVNNVTNLSYSLRPLKIESPRTFAIRVTYRIE